MVTSTVTVYVLFRAINDELIDTYQLKSLDGQTGTHSLTVAVVL